MTWPRTIRAMVSHSHRADGHEEQNDVLAEKNHQQDDENGERQRVKNIHDAHHAPYPVLPPANPEMAP